MANNVGAAGRVVGGSGFDIIVFAAVIDGNLTPADEVPSFRNEAYAGGKLNGVAAIRADVALKHTAGEKVDRNKLSRSEYDHNGAVGGGGNGDGVAADIQGAVAGSDVRIGKIVAVVGACGDGVAAYLHGTVGAVVDLSVYGVGGLCNAGERLDAEVTVAGAIGPGAAVCFLVVGGVAVVLVSPGYPRVIGGGIIGHMDGTGADAEGDHYGEGLAIADGNGGIENCGVITGEVHGAGLGGHQGTRCGVGRAGKVLVNLDGVAGSLIAGSECNRGDGLAGLRGEDVRNGGVVAESLAAGVVGGAVILIAVGVNIGVYSLVERAVIVAGGNVLIGEVEVAALTPA